MPEKPKYTPPVPPVGPVVWYPAKQGFDPVPAIVTQPGVNSVNLTVWSPDNRGGLPKDGVRHISDPSVEKQAGYEAGVWDFTEDAKRLARLESQLAILIGGPTEEETE